MTRARFTGFGLLIVSVAVAGSSLAAECTDDAFAGLSSESTRITAEIVTEGTVVARARRQEIAAPRDFCRVIGNINGNINFATASTDTGHTNADGPAWPLVDGELSEDLLTDWAHRAHYRTTLATRDVIDAYYGSEPQYSYFTGCSGAGAHGLQMAQKYPDLFDGIEVGAPANFQTGLWPGELYPSLVTHRDAGPDDWRADLAGLRAGQRGWMGRAHRRAFLHFAVLLPDLGL